VLADPVAHGFRFRTVTVIVISRLAYRKGIDLLVASAPRICAAFPNIRFVVGT
jgi:phosphatidylinositol glycan class A protein